MRPPAGSAERWPFGLAAAALVVLSAAACARTVWVADYWWQLATGRYVAERGWPSVDVFSYTAAGEPWVEPRWLFCWVQYQLTGAFGAAAATVAKWLAVVAAFGLAAFGTAAGRNRLTACALTVAALLAASQRFYERPELVTYVLFAAFIVLLDRWRCAGDRRALLALPPLQLLWANAHGLAVLGPLLVAAMIVAAALERRRLAPLVLTLAACLVACLINPWGVGGLLFPLQLFAEIRGTLFKDAITEFRGPLAWGLSFSAVRWYLGLVVVSVVSSLANWRRPDAFLLLVAGAQLYLSAQAIRNLPLFALAAVPLVLANVEVGGWLERPFLARRLRPGRRAAAVAIALVCAGYAWGMTTNRWQLSQNDSNRFGLGLARHRYPIAAAERLARRGVEGRVFSTLVESSYLVHAGTPVFFDPRLEVYGEERFRRFLLVQHDRAAWDAAAAEYDIRAALVDLESPAAKLLTEHEAWDLVDFDEVAAVFVRDAAAAGLPAVAGGPAFADAVARVRQALPPPRPYAAVGLFEAVAAPHPYLALADFLLMQRQADAAEAFLRDAASAYPLLSGLHLRWATLAELRGDWRRVADEARAGLAETPDSAPLALKLGTAYFRQGETGPAREWLERAVAGGAASSAATWGMLGNLYTGEQEFERAHGCFARALALDPRETVYAISLAQVRARRGDLAGAIATLERAQALEPDNDRILRDLARFRSARAQEAP